ncbi:metallophosphoesterase [Gammaproteobacteria bacterium]|nr:metallophosphoesterase [Gammaproteobacteria bacterium]
MSQVILVGDIHGCFYTFEQLLTQLSPRKKDQLISLGDLTGKGPHSEKVLDEIIKRDAEVVLGNHDVYFIAWLLGIGHKRQEYQGITEEKKSRYLQWLQQKKFCIQIEDCLVVHAGIHYKWSISETLYWAQSLEDLLKTDPGKLVYLMQKPPMCWHDQLSVDDKLAMALYTFTKLRYFKDVLPVGETGEPKDHLDLTPWYMMPHQVSCRVYFGHWAALGAQPISDQWVHLDGGAVYGRDLVGYKTQEDQQFRQTRDQRDEC